MRQKGSIVTSKKESTGCNDRDTVTFCDSLNIGTNVTSAKETVGANMHHSFSTKRSYMGKRVRTHLEISYLTQQPEGENLLSRAAVVFMFCLIIAVRFDLTNLGILSISFP